MTWPESFWASARFLSEAAGWEHGGSRGEPSTPRRGSAAWTPDSASEKPSRRTSVTRVQQVEVIGGNSLPPLKPLPPPRDAAGSWPPNVRLDPTIIGPPRLPSELINLILLLAASDLASGGSQRRTSRRDINSILSLCAVDRLAHRSILRNVILPSLTLRGGSQLQAFARDAVYGLPELRHSLDRIQTLRVRSDRRLNEAAAPMGGHLYSLADDTARFQRLVTRHLLPVLSRLEGLRSLTLECAPEVLDHRLRSAHAGNLEELRRGLEELCCLGTLFAGDLNEALWLPVPPARFPEEERIGMPPPPPPPPHRWANLTSLQLHGPRMRLTRSTARSLSQLPNLRRLALIAVLVQPSAATHPQPDSWRPAREASCVLQELARGLERTLELLVYVGHDVEDYVGNTERMRSRLRGVTRRWRDDGGEGERPSRLRIRLVTASLAPQSEATEGNEDEDEASLSLEMRPQPALFSRWVMDRAERGLHWDWDLDLQDGAQGQAVGEEDESGRRLDRSTTGFPTMRYVVEGSDAPDEEPPASSGAPWREDGARENGGMVGNGAAVPRDEHLDLGYDDEGAEEDDEVL